MKSASGHVQPRPDVETHRLADHGAIPNNSLLPVLIYRAAVSTVSEHDPASIFERLFKEQNWLGTWRNGIYAYHHYHSTSHEVLGVYAGEVSVCLGGEEGVRTTLRQGDVVVIPAGVGHCNEGCSADFRVVGAYPEGRACDLLVGTRGERPKADHNISVVPLPQNDPLPGLDGSPLRDYWRHGKLG